MAIGFTITQTGARAIPDRNLQKGSKPRTLMAKFGDGYEQRLVDGINNIETTYSVSFVNRRKTEIDDIVRFFDSLQGVASFAYTYPDTNDGDGFGSLETTVNVVCETYDLTYVNDEFYNCTATFRRVYEL